MNLNMWGDFQFCISVPLKRFKRYSFNTKFQLSLKVAKIFLFSLCTALNKLNPIGFLRAF